MVKVKVYNTQYDHKDAYFFEVAEFNTYEGDEVKIKWVKPEELALSTGNPEFPFRVIRRNLIREINGLPYSFDAPVKESAVRLVKGSNGKVYEVTANSCTCPGFTFRGTCKHVTETTATA
jgi:hypothetical protein